MGKDPHFIKNLLQWGIPEIQYISKHQECPSLWIQSRLRIELIVQIAIFQDLIEIKIYSGRIKSRQNSQIMLILDIPILIITIPKI